MSNLPPGTTHADIDRHYEPTSPPPDPEPTRPECTVCGRVLRWKKTWEDDPRCAEHEEDGEEE